jgi:uncharacterized membrane protein YccC
VENGVVLRWLRQRDPTLSALRRACRAALVMPAMFALGLEVIGNATIATFAAFGSFATLVLVDFPGPLRARLQAQASLVVAGGVLVCLGTLASSSPALAAVSMAAVAFAVLFASVVSSVLAAATTSLLLAFILPVCLPAPASDIPDRLAGWFLAGSASILAVGLLWPAPARNRVRSAAIDATSALATRLRALAGESDSPDVAVARADAALDGLHGAFFATPYRPTGLSTAARAVVRLVDELRLLNDTAAEASTEPGAAPTVLAAAAVLERAAELLDAPAHSPDALRAAEDELHARLRELERSTMLLPAGAGGRRKPISALDPRFRAQELSFLALELAANIEFAAAAERRTWLEQLLGRQPAGLTGRLSAAGERAGSYVARSSVALQNSVRGAVGLGIAVLLADLLGVQHAFWVVLGTLSVLRSNALNTGQDVLRGLLGTVIGLVLGGLLVTVIGTDTTVLWIVLPVAVLLAAVAPAAVSFTAGQAAFTITLLVLFNILAPEGWRVGLVRVEDVALGGAVSLAVGLLLWPRGAGGALGRALASGYTASAAYLAAAVRFGLGRCDGAGPATARPTGDAMRAAAAGRRLDDAFRSYLFERGHKPLPLADVTTLVSGVAGLRLAGDAVLGLWDGPAASDGDRGAARAELLAGSERMTVWYGTFAASLASGSPVPDPLLRDRESDARLVAAVSHDLRTADGHVTGTAVRMIWTGDHLDAARRLQRTLVAPGRTAVERHALDAHGPPLRRWLG